MAARPTMMLLWTVLCVFPLSVRTLEVSGTAGFMMVDFWSEGQHFKVPHVTTDEGDMYYLNSHHLQDSWIPGNRVTVIIKPSEAESNSVGTQLPEFLRAQEPIYDVDQILSNGIDEVLSEQVLDSDSQTNQFRGNRHSLLAIRLCYRNGCPGAKENAIQEWLWGDHFSNDVFFRESSFGLVSFPKEKGAVMTVHIDANIDKCDLGKMIREGEAAAKKMHTNPADFMHVTFYPPGEARCPFGGVAWGGSPWRPARHSFMNMGDWGVIAHEIGHNVGAPHASTDRLDDGVKDNEYGDASSVMGGLGGQFTSVRKALFGYIPQSSQISHPGCGNLGPSQVTLQALDLQPGSTPGPAPCGASLLRIPRAAGGHYYVSYRRDRGIDSNMNKLYKNKVHVHVRVNGNPLIVGMFDASTTCKPNGKERDGRNVGDTCVSSDGGWSGKTIRSEKFNLRVVGMNEESATIRIDLPHASCPSRQGLTGKEETIYNPALSSYFVHGRCDPLGVEGYSRPSKMRGLGNQNNLQWCPENKNCHDRVTVDTSLCASGQAKLAFIKKGAMHGCKFTHYAQYTCVGDNPQVCPSVTSTTTTTTPLTDIEWLDLSGKAATQSSTDWKGNAERAIDGNANPWWGGQSCTHTATESSPWWQVDLGSTQSVRAVKVTNRAQYGDRLNPFSIRVDDTLCASNVRVNNGETKQILCAGVGQKIRVELSKAAPLTICEFEVAVSTVIPTTTATSTSTTRLVSSTTTTTTTAAPTSTTTTTTSSTTALAVQSGDTVFFKTRSGNGKHIHVEGSAVRAAWESHGSWQAIVIEKKEKQDQYLSSGDIIFLKTHTDAHIDVVNEVVSARWNAHGDWQSMVIEKKTGGGRIFDGDVVCLKAHTAKYLDVEDDAVRARWNDCGDWQAMQIQREVEDAVFSGAAIRLQAHTGKHIEVEGTSVGARWSDAGEWQTFTISNLGGRAIFSGDAVFLKSHTDAYVDVQNEAVQARWPEKGDWQKLFIERKDGSGAVMPGDAIFLRTHMGTLVDVEGAAVRARWWDHGLWQTLRIETQSSESSARRLTQNADAPIMI